MLREGGGETKRYGVVITQELEVLAILKLDVCKRGGGG